MLTPVPLIVLLPTVEPVPHWYVQPSPALPPLAVSVTAVPTPEHTVAGESVMLVGALGAVFIVLVTDVLDVLLHPVLVLRDSA